VERNERFDSILNNGTLPHPVVKHDVNTLEMRASCITYRPDLSAKAY